MAKVKPKSKKVGEKTDAKLVIPVAIREASVDDELNAILDTVLPEATATKRKGDRPNMELSPEGQKSLADWIPLQENQKEFKKALDTARGELDGHIAEARLKAVWKHKCEPVNPILQVKKKDGTVDHQALAVYTTVFDIQVKDPKKAVESTTNLLIEVGLHADKAKALVENEISFKPKLDIDLTRLTKGYKTDDGWVEATDTDKITAKKILTYIMQSPDLTPDERMAAKAAIIRKPNTTIRDGFLDRVCGYCTTEDELRGVFTIIEQRKQLRSVEFAKNDPLDDRNRRQIEEAASTLGVALGVSE